MAWGEGIDRAGPALLAVLTLALFPPLLHGQELHTIGGRVADEADAPLPGVLVSVPATYFATTTDEEGRFSLDLPAGSWRLRLRRIGYEPASLSVTVGPETNAVTVRLRAKPVELKGLTVEGRRRGVLEQTVTRETVRQAPPLVEPDVFRALVLLPGVTQPNDIKGRIHLAAGASDETGVRLDGHPLQDPFHLLGVLGAFNVAALDRAEVRMHHLPARLGGYLSGVIDLETRTGAEPQYEGILSLLATSATTLQPDLPGGLDVLASGRLTYVDRLAPLISSEIPKLGYYDGLLRLGRSFGDGWRGELLGFSSMDFFRGGELRGDSPAESFRWGENLLGFRLLKRGGGWSVRARASTSSAGTSVDERPERPRHIDTDLDWGSAALELTRRSHLWMVGVGASLDRRVHRQAWTGLSATELVSPSVPEAFSGRDERTVLALHGHGGLRLSSGIEAEGGLRLLAGEGREHLAPRLLLTWRAEEDLSFALAAGRRYQFTTLAEEPIEGNIAPPRFLLERPRSADVLSLGADWHVARAPLLGGELNLSASLFWKDYDDRALLARGEDGDPAEPFPTFDRVEGSGYGALLSARMPLGEAGYFQGSYAYQRAREVVGGERFTADWDAPHDLSLFTSLPLSASWSLNTALQVRSGSATTPFRGLRVVSSLRGRTIPSLLPGRRNDGRLPPYFRLDLGVRHRWRWQGARWAFFAQVLNATAHDNALEPDVRELLGLRRGDPRSGLPLLPSLGVEVRW